MINGFAEPVRVNVILENWVNQNQVVKDRLRAFHDQPESPELLTAYVDAREVLDDMPMPGQRELPVDFECVEP